MMSFTVPMLGVALLVVPRRLRWSRRSRRVLTLGATGMIGVPVVRRTLGWGRGVERANMALVGIALVTVQYLLSEEESSVRGAIALIGGLLVACAAGIADKSEDEAMHA